MARRGTVRIHGEDRDCSVKWRGREQSGYRARTGTVGLQGEERNSPVTW